MEARPTPSHKPFLTVAEAAELTGFCEAHIRNLIKRGEMPGRRAGRAYTIPASVFYAWLRGEVKPVTTPAPRPWS